MAVKLVVFDLAGTTIRDDGSITRAFADAMEAYGYQVPDEVINPLMGYKKHDAIRSMLDRYEPNTAIISDKLVALIHERFEENMVHHYAHADIRPLPNSERVFQWLQEKGIRVGFNTGFSRVIAQTILDRLGWLSSGLANHLIASDEVPGGRPYPFMIMSLMHAAGIQDAQQVIKVGDTEVDINEGKNAHCLLSIGVTTGAFTRDGLAPYQPSYIIDDLLELIPIIEANT